MTLDTDNCTEEIRDEATPPLCLVHYFTEWAAGPPERPRKPPGARAGRVAERQGNLIILEFAPPPKPAPVRWRGGTGGKNVWMRVCDALLLLLFLASLLGCAAAFRY